MIQYFNSFTNNFEEKSPILQLPKLCNLIKSCYLSTLYIAFYPHLHSLTSLHDLFQSNLSICNPITITQIQYQELEAFFLAFL